MARGKQPDCIFCRVIAGELPSREAYSGELTYAFHDLRPVAPVHVLVVPREHIDDATEVGAEHGALLVEMLLAARTDRRRRRHFGQRLPPRVQYRTRFGGRGAPPPSASCWAGAS